MKSTRTRHLPEFKAKGCLGRGSRRGHGSRTFEAVRRSPNQIYKWKREFLDNAARTFSGGEEKSSGSEREAELLKKIGGLTVERDFSSKGLGRLT